MTSAKILNLNLNNNNNNNNNTNNSNNKKCNEFDNIVDNSSNKNKTKKLSINSRNLSSTSSMNNKSPLFNDEDDDRFYDAADIDSKDLDKIIKSTNRFLLDDNDAIFDDDDDETHHNPNDQDDNDDNDDFYDTKTSRHPSEMSDSNYLVNLKHLNHHRSHRMSSHSEETLNNSKSISNETNSSRVTCLDNMTNQNQAEKSINISENVNTNNENGKDIKVEDEDDEMDFELETGWTFWIDKCVRGTSKHEYEAGLKLIHTVKTVHTFWSVFNNIPDITALPNRYSYHLMRNNRKPLWEDAENSQGGQWKLKCNKNDTSLVWRELVLAGIGEQFSDCVNPLDDIVGLTVGKREKEDIIQIWNLNHKYEKEATVCEKLKQLVPDVKFSVIFYKPHNTHEAYEGEQSSASASNNYNQMKYQSNNYQNNTINKTNNGKKLSKI